MTTVLEVVEDALEDLSVKKAEVSLTSDELQAGIRRCNDMLTTWNRLSIIKGYSKVVNSTDTLPVEDSAIGAVKANLAIKLAPSFNKTVTQVMIENAQSALNMYKASNAFIGDVAYPDSLPTGSGNECSDGYLGDRFFPANKKENF